MESSPAPELPAAADTPESTPVPAPPPALGDATPEAGPSSTPAQPPAKRYSRKPKAKTDGLVAYTTAFVPGMYNIKNPAGDYMQREGNVEVARQVSQARMRRDRERAQEVRAQAEAEGRELPPEDNPLSKILIIHPGSRYLRIGRASDFYPKEIPNCIARPANIPNRGRDPPLPGSRYRRLADRRAAKRHKPSDGDVEMNGQMDEGAGQEEEGEGEDEEDPVDTKIGHLREYLRARLRANRLATDWKDGQRVVAANQRVRAENIPEHNDPYRIDWTEVGDEQYFVGEEALRLPHKAGFKVRYPILRRSLNTRDWASPQALLDDIAVILHHSLQTELGISLREYGDFSVVLIVPDHGDRIYVQEMTNLLLGVMGFKEIAVHQEAYTAIFSAGLSSACVVDIGASQTSVTCVDEGLVNADTRINLMYGGDDITSTLTAMLQRSAFPYKELDLARTQDWEMMDRLKIKICTLEEHMVASTPWDFYVLKEQGLTQKYALRTYDENILAPLCFFDTRMIDFEEKLGEGRFKFWGMSEDVEDLLTTAYDEATSAMRQCTAHLLPTPPVQAPIIASTAPTPVPGENGDTTPSNGSPQKPSAAPSESDTPVPPSQANSTNGDVKPPLSTGPSHMTPASTPVPDAPSAVAAVPTFDIVLEASKSPLDAAIAASITNVGTENKVKAASGSILLIGGGAGLKGLSAFIAERLPPLLRLKGFPIQDVSIVPPPRNLNPKFVCWKGASVMCNLESLGDMWIRRDEWEAIGARALKERCLFF